MVALIVGATAWSIANRGQGAADRDSSHGDASACASAAAGSGDQVLAGAVAPTFTLRALDGRCINLRRYRGHPIVVNFWASWCHPCRQEFPILKAAWTEHRADGLIMLGVVHNDIAADARQFITEQHADWPMPFDGDNLVSLAYGVKPIPQTYFIRRDGTVAARVFNVGSMRDLERELAKILRT